jgi:hypothetical protein
MANTERKDRLPISVMGTAVTIESGESTSTAANLGGTNLVGILFPSSMTGSNLTFQGSLDGTNFFDIYDTAGSALTMTISANRFVALVPSDFACVRYIKLVSDGSEAAERTIQLAIRVLN